MRAFLLLALCGSAVSAQNEKRSPVYVGAPHSYWTLDRKGHAYVGGFRGSVPVTLYGDQPDGRDINLAMALTDRFAIVGRVFEGRMPWNDRYEPSWFRHRTIEAGIGRLSRGRRWKKQDQLTIGFGRSDVAVRSVDNEGPPIVRADGRYVRLSYQYSSVLRTRLLELGGVTRISGAHFTRFQRRERLWNTSPPPEPYTIPIESPGSMTGAILEPGFMLRFGFRYFKIGPELSFAVPLTQTAYGTQFLTAGFAAGINIQPGGAR